MIYALDFESYSLLTCKDYSQNILLQRIYKFVTKYMTKRKKEKKKLSSMYIIATAPLFKISS